MEVLESDQGEWRETRGEAMVGAGVWDHILGPRHDGNLEREGYRGEEVHRIKRDLLRRPVAYLLLRQFYHLFRKWAGRWDEVGDIL